MPQLTREQLSNIREQKLFRTLEVDADSADEEARTVEASLSSEIEIQRWFGREKLIHTAEACDLSRAVDGLPMLFNHERNAFIGLIQDVRIEDKRLVGTLHFSNNSRAEEIWQDVRDGMLKDISIGYQILELAERTDDDLVRVTEWELLEASIVTIPADQSVGIGRAAEDLSTADTDGNQQRAHDMPKANAGDGAEVTPDSYENVRKLAVDEGRLEGQRLEAERRAGLDLLFRSPRFQGAAFVQLQRAAIDDSWTVETTREKLLDLIGKETGEPLGGGNGFTQTEHRGDLSIEMGEDGGDKFARGVELALAVKAGLEDDKELKREAQDGEFLGMSFPEIAREYLRTSGGNTRGLSNPLMTVVRAMQHRAGSIGQGSGSLTSITENIANKAVLKGYEEATETWRLIASVNSTPDFKQFSRTGISSFEDLDIVDENGEYKLGKFGDRAEKGQIVKFGKRWGISMEALANDELGVLLTAGRKMGRAGQRAVGNAVYAVLTDNPVLNQDNVALFNAAHNNIMADGGLPSVARLDEMMVAMATQTDSSGSAEGLNIELARVITPVSMKTSARVLSSSQFDPAVTNANSNVPNPFNGTFVPVADARLTGTTWYGMADPNMHDTIEVTFLNGQDEPLLLSKEGWTVDGIEMKVMMPCVAIPLDFRTMVRNPGA